ncbi:MAG: hypothetical protein J5725_12490 [Bacteroidales bacterium]|nr:hypothetical protein [Bacteroidales bacterium]
MPKTELGTVLVYIAVGFGIIVIILLAFMQWIDSVSDQLNNAQLYEQPTWTELTESTTTKETKADEL